MTTPGPYLCLACRHRRWSAAPRDDDRPTCAAFPDGIPEAISPGGGDHTRPWPGDHGITFALPDRDAPDRAHAERVYSAWIRAAATPRR